MMEGNKMKKSQVFTPEDIAVQMLDLIEYREGLFGKKILEDSFGSGNILTLIVKRYVEDCLGKNYSLTDIKIGLERDIYGVEINPKLYQDTIKRLNDLMLEYQIKGVQWNLLNANIFSLEWKAKFDYIVSNPPYIKYHELTLEEREYLKLKFNSCRLGNFDYYYAFIENAQNMLTKNGKMVHLIPNSIFKNVYANTLRSMIKGSISFIRSYKDKEVFKGVLVSPVMILVDKSNKSKIVGYQNDEGSIVNIDKEILGEKWIFHNEIKLPKKKERFGDYFTVAMPVATLLNEAFILKNVVDIGSFYRLEGNDLEKEVIRKAASPKGMSKGKEEYIIYPYYYENDKLRRYDESIFRRKFPNVSKYLETYNERLNKRKSSKNVQWFEYGRTQALANLNQPKLLISTVITNTVKVYELDKDTIPYAGCFIIAKENQSLEDAKKILLSNDFIKYINLIGTTTTRNSIRVTAKDIENFRW